MIELTKEILDEMAAVDIRDVDINRLTDLRDIVIDTKKPVPEKLRSFADTGESSIVLPVKNFINDSYCRDISTKVKSQFEVKRKNGECIAPFAVYGYLKSEADRNKLVIDEYAAENVRKIFEIIRTSKQRAVSSKSNYRALVLISELC